MWSLKKIGDEAKVVYILPEKTTFTVGRTGVDLVLKDDASISRSHASLSLEKGVLQIFDNNSKYGVYVNDGIFQKQRIGKEKVILKPKDKIRFGLMNNVWKLDKVTINSLGSALKIEETGELIDIINQVGGNFLENISNECTHLTMSQLTVTLKLLYALVYEKPIVRLDYWKAYLTALRSPDQQLPDPENYIPKATDLCKDVKFKTERRNLFEGFTFIFLNGKQFKMYNDIIQKIGGTCKNLSSGVQKTLLIKPKVIVIQYIPITQSQSSQTISTIGDLLKKNKKRLVPEYEIGLAIVTCSLKKFCNPDENAFSNLLTKGNESEKSANRNGESVFVENSIPNENTKASMEEDFVVAETDETYQDSNESKTSNQSSTLCDSKSNSNKRSRPLALSNIEEDDIIESPGSDEEKTTKKPRIEETIEESLSPQPSFSRSLRSKNLSNAKKEIATINKTKPAKTNQNFEKNNNKEFSTKLKAKDSNSLYERKKKSNLQSIDLSSSSEEESSLKKNPIKRNTRATGSSKLDAATVREMKKQKAPQSISLDSGSDAEENEKAKSLKSNDLDENETQRFPVPGSDDKEMENLNPSKQSQPESSNSLGFGKRKRTLQFIDNEDSDLDEDDLFNFSKKHHNEDNVNDFETNSPSSSTTNSLKDSTQKSTNSSQQLKSPVQRNSNKSPYKASPRPLPLTTRKKTTTINIADFTDISQKVPIASSTQKQNTSLDNSKKDSSTESSRKRFYIPVLGSDDDDDDNGDNLFNFIGDEKKKPRLQNKQNDDDSDEELFAFTDNKSDKNADDPESLAVEQQNTNTLGKPNDEPPFQLPKPKPLPSKINISDWFSCSGIKKEIKEEETSIDQQESTMKKVNVDGDTDNGDSLVDETKVKQEWLESLKGGFQVRFGNLSISSYSNDGEKADNRSSCSNNVVNKTVRNFKAFVKKRNLFPQTTVIKLKASA